MRWSRTTRTSPSGLTSIRARADREVEVAIVGAGIAGIAAAYYLATSAKIKSVLLIDSRQPMSFTSAQSGDNYRNWWPHRTMAEFINDSIDELERLALESDNAFSMTRRGYCLASRSDDVAASLAAIPGDIDVDVVEGQPAIARAFPALSAQIQNVIHIRRGGDISGQQLGQYLLGRFSAAGGRRLHARVTAIRDKGRYELTAMAAGQPIRIRADILVNAAGPYVNEIAAMIGESLPVKNVFQQKIAFEDHLAAIPRDMPFSIDLDAGVLPWTDDERRLLGDDPELAWLTGTLPGGRHCRPEGARNGKWVKLGWAYNKQVASKIQDDLANDPAIDASFPEIVIRGAAGFIPSLEPYINSPPTRFSHYGGYYTMTEENWPLVGPLNDRGAFLIGALSGFGSMAACSAAKLCCAQILSAELPGYAADLSLARLDKPGLLAELRAMDNKGLL